MDIIDTMKTGFKNTNRIHLFVWRLASKVANHWNHGRTILDRRQMMDFDTVKRRHGIVGHPARVMF